MIDHKMRVKREQHHGELHGRTLKWRWWRFMRGIRRLPSRNRHWWKWQLTSPIRKPRHRIKKWIYKDRRPPSSGYPYYKYAINRDGDLYLVECPQCGWQQLSLRREEGEGPQFHCTYCRIRFKLYIEDGIVTLRDYRSGDVRLPATVVYNDQRTACLGLTNDALWWWRKAKIVRDLHDGMDGHGHAPYEILGPIEEQLVNLNEASDRENEE